MTPPSGSRPAVGGKGGRGAARTAGSPRRSGRGPAVGHGGTLRGGEPALVGPIRRRQGRGGGWETYPQTTMSTLLRCGMPTPPRAPSCAVVACGGAGTVALPSPYLRRFLCGGPATGWRRQSSTNAATGAINVIGWCSASYSIVLLTFKGDMSHAPRQDGWCENHAAILAMAAGD